MSTLAMHASDGLLDAPTSLLFGAVAVSGLAVATVRARRELDDRTAPLAGLVAAFVFAVQMLNFPVLPGVSGHLLGGALAAILVGPWTGALCVSVVLVVQALLFADGGLTALGANITNMALLGTAAGYLVAVALRRFATRSRAGLLAVAFTAALVNTVVAAGGFVVEYAIGGQGAVSLGGFAAALLGVHVLIGVGEGVITALTVGAVASARPDLVHLLRGAPVAREVAR
ncbi:cobalamin biosynthesis protein CbiM [Prauserella sp. PE36]|uniref:energy-coupling factor ABC transporter permease n=1 Tax=Prauserella sp. PE36 TaxID=1504709 RepID=UPI000D9D50E0|nr:energy-coupling factor ABC transporter permease [Prauserella sp. PE36]PXY24927.1 cobalamin biosynthesis protein CbiM [Prauserella coralliicola]RBM16927.1 cobalamin biosynthesis protein CbiM [Prauserella sp. PE36]